VEGADVGAQVVDPVGMEPLGQGAHRLGRKPPPLPSHACDPGQLRRAAAADARDGGLHGSDGCSVALGADDPIEPDLARDLGTGQEVAVAVAKHRQGQRAAADELVEGGVTQHCHHLVGIVDGQRRQDEPLAHDRPGEYRRAGPARRVDG